MDFKSFALLDFEPNKEPKNLIQKLFSMLKIHLMFKGK